MKVSRRKTLTLKTTACQYCKLADKTRLRQGREYCHDANIKNGHCLNFQSEKPKKGDRHNGTN